MWQRKQRRQQRQKNQNWFQKRQRRSHRMQVGLPNAWMGWGVLQARLIRSHHCLHSSSSGEHAQLQ